MTYGFHKAFNRKGRRARLALIPRKDESQSHTGGIAPASSGDNTGGNQGGTSSDSNTPDNSGQQEPDYSKFWETPEAPKTPTPESNQESAAGGQSASGVTNDSPTLGDQIAALNFGNSIMTDDVVKELAEGKTEKFHENLNQFGRQTVESTIRTMIPILAQVRDQLRQEFQQGVDSSLTKKDDESALLAAIPSAKNPTVRPQVDAIYQQSLKHSGGNREKAIQMTKDMMRLVVKGVESDIDLPPRTQGDSTGVSSNVDWLSELSGRS